MLAVILKLAEVSFGQIIPIMSQAAFSLLENSLLPVAECLTSQSAARIANMKTNDEVQNRIDELADKCNKGQLPPKNAPSMRCSAGASSIWADSRPRRDGCLR
jgi:hypothetical protein